MNHVRSLGFESLEGRKLLSAAHVAKAATAPAVAGSPLVLSGTLAVDENGADSVTNGDGSTTMTVPVSGRLGTLGEFRGLWVENYDQFGDLEAPDVLRLQNSKGGLIIEFNNLVSGKAYKLARGTFYYVHAQTLALGTGAYAHDTESGTIELMVSAAKNEVKSMVLETQNP